MEKYEEKMEADRAQDFERRPLEIPTPLEAHGKTGAQSSELGTHGFERLKVQDEHQYIAQLTEFNAEFSNSI